MDVHDGQIAVDIEIHMVGILDQRILLKNNVLFMDRRGTMSKGKVPVKQN